MPVLIDSGPMQTNSGKAGGAVFVGHGGNANLDSSGLVGNKVKRRNMNCSFLKDLSPLRLGE